MPLVDFDPPVEKVEATGRAVPVELKTAVVETRFTPLQSLLTQITGSRYVVDYYSQLLAGNDTPKALQLELAAPYQQYDLIRQLEMRLQGDLSFSVDEDTKVRTVTGNAILYPGMIPNDGDMFIADAGAGRAGIFTVTSSTPLSYYKQTCHEINFTLIAFVDEDPTRARSLAEKVVTTKHFVADFMRFGKNPIIVDQLFTDYRELHRVRDTMISEYMRLFFSEVTQTLLIPGQAAASYDPFLTKAVLSLMETTESPLLRKLTAHITEMDYAYRTTTVWDAILQMEPSHLYLACHQMGLVPAALMRTRPYLGGVFWSKAEYLMYPIDPREDADKDLTYTALTSPEPLADSPASVHDFNRIVAEKDATGITVVDVLDPDETVPNIHPVIIDTYYVFSKAFYEEDYTGMSVLEKLVWDALNQKELDVPKLAALVKQSKRWDKLERFYYVPVLVALCVLALRGPSSL